MAEAPATVSVRPMTAEDVEQVMQIAASTPQAPHWQYASYRTALDPQAAPRRIALVAEIQESSIRPSHPAETSPPCAGEKAQGWGTESSDSPAGLIVAGFAVASVLDAQAELESIAVASALRRRGVARRLLAALVEELRRLGAADLLLEVRASNQAALELYGGCGFQPVALRSRYYIDPVEDAVLMTARLR